MAPLVTHKCSCLTKGEGGQKSWQKRERITSNNKYFLFVWHEIKFLPLILCQVTKSLVTGTPVQRSHDNITLFRGRGSPRWPGDAAISDWDAVMGRQNWSTPRAHNIISLLTGATNIKCRWLLWSKDTTLQPSASNSESQPNWRSVSGAITIIAQDYKFTCRPGIHYQWSLRLQPLTGSKCLPMADIHLLPSWICMWQG